MVTGDCSRFDVIKAFHPNATQVLDLPTDGLIGLGVYQDGLHPLAIINLSGLKSCRRFLRRMFYIELSEERIYSGQSIEMRPYQVRWLSKE